MREQKANGKDFPTKASNKSSTLEQKLDGKQRVSRACDISTYKASNDVESPKTFVGTRSNKFPSKRKFKMLCR